MPMRRRAIAALMPAAFACAAYAQAQSPYGIGRVATPAEIAGWNIDIGRDGRGLPPGSGTVGRSREVFEQQCASCHGEKGEGSVGDRLVGRAGDAHNGQARAHRRQLLAIRTDVVRLHPSRHAAECTAIAEQRGCLRGLGLHSPFERLAASGCHARCEVTCRNQNAEPRKIYR